MKISATIKNSSLENDITVETESVKKKISIPAKPTGQGSSINGGELLFLSLATCFCNDLYREAVRRNISINSVDVTVSGQFGKEGEPGSTITYTVDIDSDSAQQELSDLIHYVDQVAEIHNTLRRGASVSLIS